MQKGIGARAVMAFARATAEELGLPYVTTGCIMHGIARACDPDLQPSSLPVCEHAEQVAELADDLRALRVAVAAAGLDPGALWSELEAVRIRYAKVLDSVVDDRGLRLHSQATLVWGTAQDLAETGSGGTVTARHVFVAVLTHPDGTVHEILRRFGTTPREARTTT